MTQPVTGPSWQSVLDRLDKAAKPIPFNTRLPSKGERACGKSLGTFVTAASAAAAVFTKIPHVDRSVWDCLISSWDDSELPGQDDNAPFVGMIKTIVKFSPYLFTLYSGILLSKGWFPGYPLTARETAQRQAELFKEAISSMDQRNN